MKLSLTVIFIIVDGVRPFWLILGLLRAAEYIQYKYLIYIMYILYVNTFVTPVT